MMKKIMVLVGMLTAFACGSSFLNSNISYAQSSEVVSDKGNIEIYLNDLKNYLKADGGSGVSEKNNVENISVKEQIKNYFTELQKFLKVYSSGFDDRKNFLSNGNWFFKSPDGVKVVIFKDVLDKINNEQLGANFVKLEFDKFLEDKDKDYIHELFYNEEKNQFEIHSQSDNYAVNVKGEKLSDWVNECYTDTYDCDYLGKLNLILFSKNKADSVFWGREKIRIEFFDAAGNKVMTKVADAKGNVGSSVELQQNGVDEIDKFELKFGQTYKLKFYDEINDELLATYDLEVSKPKKSDSVADFKFEIPEEGTSPSLNVFKGETDQIVSDRLSLVMEKMADDSFSLKLSCLSNDNNDDSVFKNSTSLIVDFVDKNGEVLYSQKTGDAKRRENCNVVKSRDLEIASKPGDFYNKISTINFYDGDDYAKKKLVAKWKISEGTGRLFYPKFFGRLRRSVLD